MSYGMVENHAMCFGAFDMRKAHWLVRDVTTDKCYYIPIHPELLVYVSQAEAVIIACPISIDHAFVIENASKPVNKMLTQL